MISHLRSLLTKSLSLFVLISLIILAGCDSGTPGSGNGTSSSPKTHQIHLTVGGKLDTEAQLLTKMYVLLLRHAGFDVTEKAALGPNTAVFNAIMSGQIDLYPEFTADGLAQLGKQPTKDAQQDYQTVSQGYKSQYHITWLDPAPLNDTYGICTLKATASEFNWTNISDLALEAPNLTIATPPDGKQYGIDVVTSAYGINFSNTIPLTSKTAENDTFQVVIKGQAQLNVCYTTNPLIFQDNFVQLTDDKQAFPIYNPAPIVRNDTLAKAPEIANILNPLASKLNNDVSIMLQAQVASGFSITEVATNWLESQSLL